MIKIISSILKHQRIKIAILAALPEEIKFVMEHFGNKKKSPLYVAEFEFDVYQYHHADILLAPTGFGNTFAASALTLINSIFQPQYVLLIGTAGAIKKEVEIGDVIIADTAFEAELMGLLEAVKNTPFEQCFFHPFKKKAFSAFYSASSELVSLSDSLDFDKLRIHKGIVVSSNAFPAPRELFAKIKKLEPLSIDMETAAFYQTAWLLNLKTLAIRGISNKLNNVGEDDKLESADIDGSMRAATTVLLKLVDEIVENRSRRYL